MEAPALNTTGSGNTAYGAQALLNNVTGVENTAIGAYAGQNLTGNFNFPIGGFGVDTDNNTTQIGSVQNRAFIAD